MFVRETGVDNGNASEVSAGNIMGRVGPPLVAEDMNRARESFARLGELDFDVAVFGHGKPIMEGASQEFRAAAAAS